MLSIYSWLKSNDNLKILETQGTVTNFGISQSFSIGAWHKPTFAIEKCYGSCGSLSIWMNFSRAATRSNIGKMAMHSCHTEAVTLGIYSWLRSNDTLGILGTYPPTEKKTFYVFSISQETCETRLKKFFFHEKKIFKKTNNQVLTIESLSHIRLDFETLL